MYVIHVSVNGDELGYVGPECASDTYFMVQSVEDAVKFKSLKEVRQCVDSIENPDRWTFRPVVVK